MSGIIGTFQMRTEFSSIPDHTNGYCHIAKIQGGSLVDVNEQNPNGQWEVFLKYYYSLADFDGNPNSFINVDNIYYVTEDPNVKIPIYQQIKVPYVPHTDPVDAIKVVLQSWWPKGEIVP